IVRRANSFAAQILRVMFGGRKKNLAELICDDSILLFRLRNLAAAATSLDMRKRDIQSGGEQRPGEGGIGIAIDEDPIRVDGAQDGFDTRHHPCELRTCRAGTDSEIEIRCGNLHLIEKDAGDVAVVVLTGMKNLVLDWRFRVLRVVFRDRPAEWGQLDKLRT